MPGWLAVALTVVLVVGHLGVGRYGAVPAFGTILLMVGSSSYSNPLIAQILFLALSSGLLLVRDKTAQAAYWRRVRRVAQFRDDVDAVRRSR